MIMAVKPHNFAANQITVKCIWQPQIELDWKLFIFDTLYTAPIIAAAGTTYTIILRVNFQ